MDAAVIADGPDSADQLRSLYEWLTGVAELRGRVSLRESPPPAGTLGPALDAVALAIGPGGAATAFAAAAISWLRNRHGEVRITVMLQGRRSVKLTAKRVAGLDAAALERQMEQITALFDEAERLDGS